KSPCALGYRPQAPRVGNPASDEVLRAGNEIVHADGLLPARAGLPPRRTELAPAPHVTDRIADAAVEQAERQDPKPLLQRQAIGAIHIEHESGRLDLVTPTHDGERYPRPAPRNLHTLDAAIGKSEPRHVATAQDRDVAARDVVLGVGGRGDGIIPSKP